jgi:RNA polymerase sigma-70 factor (ECF subfamily)
VIVMQDLEGFGAPEIAAELGVPVNTVYSRIRLARDEFRDAVRALQQKGGAS